MHNKINRTKIVLLFNLLGVQVLNCHILDMS